MRFQVALTLIVGQLSFLLLAAPVALPQEAATIKTEVRLVNLTITAAEADSGRLIPGLSREDFEVLEDGIPQNVEYFGKSSEVALSLGIVLDASGSQDKFVKDHRRDIDAFLQQTLKDGDRVMLTGFGSNIRLLQEFTADSKAIVEAAYGYDKKPGRFPMLGPVIPRGFGDGSSVFDAIYNTIRERLAKVEGGAQGVAAILGRRRQLQRESHAGCTGGCPARGCCHLRSSLLEDPAGEVHQHPGQTHNGPPGEGHWRRILRWYRRPEKRLCDNRGTVANVVSGRLPFLQCGQARVVPEHHSPHSETWRAIAPSERIFHS
ncbi:MAG: VWA domain-containing protein [Acidobacteria bacterium]|nr:VWA domain-containing protein [Acidobacteriota bacterium]